MSPLQIKAPTPVPERHLACMSIEKFLLRQTVIPCSLQNVQLTLRTSFNASSLAALSLPKASHDWPWSDSNSYIIRVFPMSSPPQWPDSIAGLAVSCSTKNASAWALPQEDPAATLHHCMELMKPLYRGWTPWHAMTCIHRGCYLAGRGSGSVVLGSCVWVPLSAVLWASSTPELLLIVAAAPALPPSLSVLAVSSILTLSA